MDRGISASVAVAAVMAGSVCNAATRLCLPTAADKVGRVICVKVVLVVAVIAMLLLVFAPAGITTVCVVMMYACYGGIMGSFPSLSSSIFGENYGYVMFGIAVATLSAPAITNTVLGNGYDINAVFAIGAFSAALALISLILLEREIKKEKVNACQTAVCQEGE